MGLFKDIYCAECGVKTKLLLRTRLADDNYLCFECASIIPSHMMDSVTTNYTLEDYRALKGYVQYSNTALRPIFHETHHYYSLHIDTENHLFYIGSGIAPDTVFLHFRNIEDFDLIFSAEEFKEGVIGDKVSGKIMFRIKMNNPVFYYETIFDRCAKAKAKKSFFGSSISYDNPKGMDDFLSFFMLSMRSDQETPYTYEDDISYEEPSAFPNELQQAMALFMIDDLAEISLSDLKDQRNRLIKTFHPDKDTDNDTKYAQKINSAYKVLKSHVDQT